MKLKLFAICLLLSPSMLYAQKGEIDAATLAAIKSSYSKDASTKALHNAILSNKSLKTLALNSEVAGKIDNNFKYKVTGNNFITDQQQSGRCWMFTSMNVFRPTVKEKFNLSSFDFSHNYNYFWDLFEKSNLFLENMILTAKKDIDDREVVAFLSSPIDDGGVWNHFYNVSKKYGVVPQSVMPETVHSNNTSALLSILKERLRKGGFEMRESGKSEQEMRATKVTVMKDV
ncbi:MAG: C1 family peptidase, partial [Rikenellaceae bacterium]